VRTISYEMCGERGEAHDRRREPTEQDKRLCSWGFGTASPPPVDKTRASLMRDGSGVAVSLFRTPGYRRRAAFSDPFTSHLLAKVHCSNHAPVRPFYRPAPSFETPYAVRRAHFVHRIVISRSYKPWRARRPSCGRHDWRCNRENQYEQGKPNHP
jgi:hypothetical protein